MSFVNDKNDLEKARVSGISEIRLLLLDCIFSISYFGIIEPLYNIFSEAKGNDFNFTPSYNV